MSEEYFIKSLFDQKGRRVNTNNYRVFQPEGLDYYSIKNKNIDYNEIIANYNKVNYVVNIELDSFRNQCELLKEQITNSHELNGLMNGVCVPFYIPKLSKNNDMADVMADQILPFVEKSFTTRFPGAQFRAILQGGATLRGNLRIEGNSRYDSLLRSAMHGPIVGLYFPQALQQYDIESQLRQMEDIPENIPLCLSGPLEIFSALIGKPDLLANEEGYSPILSMSSIAHADTRLALVLKAYGPHLEFWCLSQMLTPDLKQVSEQWAGGITVYLPFAN
jgi:hypothetical protein